MMALRKQLSMMPDDIPDQLLGDNRDKILELYKAMPEIADSDKVLILAFWEAYDDLHVVLGDRYAAFAKWFLHKATKTESIRRPRQSLTEYGHIHHTHSLPGGKPLKHSHPKAEHENDDRADMDSNRDWLEDAWHRYWGKYR